MKKDIPITTCNNCKAVSILSYREENTKLFSEFNYLIGKQFLSCMGRLITIFDIRLGKYSKKPCAIVEEGYEVEVEYLLKTNGGWVNLSLEKDLQTLQFFIL